MPGSDWQAHLKEASTDRDVLAVCNRFLTVWTFSDLGKLPASCQPKTVVELEDVGPYALSLIGPLGSGDASTAPMLHRMSTFFTKAALRLIQIAALQPPLIAAEPKAASRAS